MNKRTLDGKTVLCVEIEKSDENHNTLVLSQNTAELLTQHSNDIILEKKWISKEELSEKHLLAAMINNETIPVPEIIEIDEEIHNKLYPANFKRTSWRIIAEPTCDDKINYDLDSDDDRWLNQQPAVFNLTPLKFETYMEFLEQNSKNKVPPFTDFHTYFKSHRPTEGLEKVYDYWLDKRLANTGMPLFPQLKRVDKKTKAKNKVDPYVAFRQCREKMFLRKNRQVDRLNYMKMIRFREQMRENVSAWGKFLKQKKVEHQHLKHQFNTFIEQYQKKDFRELYVSDKPVYDTKEILSAHKLSHDEMFMDYEEEALECVEAVHLPKNSVNKYYMPTNKFPDVVDDKQKFYSSTKGLIRARVGRGGRVIIDRKQSNMRQSAEFQQFNTLEGINVRKHEDCSFIDGSSSAFRLTNACNHSLNSLEDQFYFEVE